MLTKRFLTMIGACVIAAFVTIGCGDDSSKPGKDVGSALEDAAEEAGDAAEDAVDAAEDAAEEVGDAAEDATQ